MLRRRSARDQSPAAAGVDAPRVGVRPAARALAAGAVAGAGTAVIAGVTATGVAAHYARKVVTPEAERPDDVELLAVGPGAVTFRATPETLAPGRYGVGFAGGAGHLRVGEVIDHDEQAGMVSRRLVAVDAGTPRPGPARWTGYYFFGDPTVALGLPHHDVAVPSELGPLPAWLVPPSPQAPPRTTWAILVHGRGATRGECLRGLPVLHRLGLTALVVSYRNDPGAPQSLRGRYGLGDAEWRDVEAAILYAAEHGADDVVLVGWSMGGAVVLQTIVRSWTADRVRALVLDAPVLDWRDVLDHQARVHRLPARVGRMAQAVLEHRQARRLAGLDEPLSLSRMDWVQRAQELHLPALLLHSDDDEFVPSGPSQRLAAARPDLVTYVPSRGARHTKEWNVDPQAWDAAVARFLLTL